MSSTLISFNSQERVSTSLASRSRTQLLNRSLSTWTPYETSHPQSQQRTSGAGLASSIKWQTTTSCATQRLGTPSQHNFAESVLMASIRDETHGFSAISWSLLAQETARDESLGHALHAIKCNGITDSQEPTLANLSPICDSLYAHDGILMYNNRVVVPSSLHQGILQHLHAAHQGTLQWSSEPCHCLVAQTIKGDPEHQKQLCRLPPQHPVPGCHTPHTFTTTIYPV